MAGVGVGLATVGIAVMALAAGILVAAVVDGTATAVALNDNGCRSITGGSLRILILCKCLHPNSQKQSTIPSIFSH